MRPNIDEEDDSLMALARSRVIAESSIMNTAQSQPDLQDAERTQHIEYINKSDINRKNYGIDGLRNMSKNIWKQQANQ